MSVKRRATYLNIHITKEDILLIMNKHMKRYSTSLAIKKSQKTVFLSFRHWKKLKSFFFKFIFGCNGSSLLRGLSLVVARGGLLFVVARGLLIAVASLVAEQGL